jgi:CDP-2,3-bis-(O-geranylgeranyl)-sn-glycerol synthase
MRDALLHILQLAYLMAPAYLANMAPPFVRFWKGWNRPISERWLGSHKTIVGFLLGVIVGLIATRLQSRIDASFSLLDYASWPILGVCFGFGAMLGDSAKSFLKRRLGIPPGIPWIPFDQLDFVIGALLLLLPFFKPGVSDIAIILVMTLIGDIAINRLAFLLGIKDSRW